MTSFRCQAAAARHSPIDDNTTKQYYKHWVTETIGRVENPLITIRRTASLDAIHQNDTWLRDVQYKAIGSLQVDKATQTEDCSSKIADNVMPSTATGSGHTSEEKFDKFLRHRLQRLPPSYRPAALVNASEHASQTMSPVFFQGLKSGNGVPLRAARSSVEGLNQEIERLVLCPTPSQQLERHRDKATPEGHRAPLAELLRRSVNTQTPALHDRQSHSTHSSGGSVCSSPDLDGNKLGTSPHINKFLAREPPDGCEKVNLKFTECTADSSSKSVGDLSPIKPSIGFQLRPSLGSAFQPLQPPSLLSQKSQTESNISMDD